MNTTCLRSFSSFRGTRTLITVYIFLQMIFMPYLLSASQAVIAKPDLTQALFEEVQKERPAVERCRQLIQDGADVCAKDENRFTQLHYAALAGNAVLCEMLIEAGSSLYEGAPIMHDGRFQGVDRAYPLHMAIASGNLETVTLLASSAAPHGRKWSTVCPPILQALASGTDDIVETLLAYGADGNYVSSYALTESGAQSPLEEAIRQGRSIEIIRRIAAHTNRKILSQIVHRCIAAAVENDNVGAFIWLISEASVKAYVYEQGAGILHNTEGDVSGYSPSRYAVYRPLVVAVHRGYVHLVRLLLKSKVRMLLPEFDDTSEFLQMYTSIFSALFNDNLHINNVPSYECAMTLITLGVWIPEKAQGGQLVPDEEECLRYLTRFEQQPEAVSLMEEMSAAEEQDQPHAQNIRDMVQPYFVYISQGRSVPSEVREMVAQVLCFMTWEKVVEELGSYRSEIARLAVQDPRWNELLNLNEQRDKLYPELLDSCRQYLINPIEPEIPKRSGCTIL